MGENLIIFIKNNASNNTHKENQYNFYNIVEHCMCKNVFIRYSSNQYHLDEKNLITAFCQFVDYHHAFGVLFQFFKTNIKYGIIALSR